jgi:hypothetical protein
MFKPIRLKLALRLPAIDVSCLTRGALSMIAIGDRG